MVNSKYDFIPPCSKLPPLSVTRLVTATELLTETQSQWLLSPTGDVADWHYYCSGLVLV